MDTLAIARTKAFALTIVPLVSLVLVGCASRTSTMQSTPSTTSTSWGSTTRSIPTTYRLTSADAAEPTPTAVTTTPTSTTAVTTTPTSTTATNPTKETATASPITTAPPSTTTIENPANGTSNPSPTSSTADPAPVETIAEPTEALSEAGTATWTAGTNWTITVLNTFPHDPEAFTQGLLLHEGLLYESTGLYGESTVRITDPRTGDILASASLEDAFFGEGLEVVGERLVQLTWQEMTAFIWDANTLELLGTYQYEGEGWGLCAFEDRLVMSDGSSRLTFRNLDTFEVIGMVEVTRDGEPVVRLNELECVEEVVFANVWYSEEILVISPESGLVLASIDASTLRSHLPTDGPDVLNGIAHDSQRDVFYLTGKLWPQMFEVRIEPATG